MPDTLTANLGLVKPEIDGSAETWGNKTNNNWDELDEVAWANKLLADNSLQRSGAAAMRTAGDLLLYQEAVVISAGSPQALVTQKWVKDLINTFLPIGVVIQWAGTIATIPVGWALCNGQIVGGVQTPNLADKFVMAAGASGIYVPGVSGGVGNLVISGDTADHVLTFMQMPIHNHTAIDSKHAHPVSDLGHTHPIGVTTVNNGSGAAVNVHTPSINNATTQAALSKVTVSSAAANVNIDLSGGDQGHKHAFSKTLPPEEFYPPFYAIAYIMKVLNV